MTKQSIFVQIDDERIELTGEDKEKYLAQKALDDIQEKLKADKIEAKAKAKEAAQAKLAVLGLTVEDLQALGL